MTTTRCFWSHRCDFTFTGPERNGITALNAHYDAEHISEIRAD